MRPRGVQDNLLPRLVVDVVGAHPGSLRSDPPEGDEYDDEQDVEQHRDTDPHEMIPRNVEVVGYDGRGKGRVAAVQTGHVRRADASIGADLVDAGAAVGARVCVALIHIGLATITRETLALADWAVVALLAHAPVVARIRAAIPAKLATFAAEARPDALADVITAFRHDFATAAVETGRRSTRVCVDFAGQAGESAMTLTLVVVAAHVLAGAAVLARLRAADTWRHQDSRRIAAELDVGESLEHCHAVSAAHVQRHGYSGDPDIVHAADETALHILEADDRWMLPYFGAQIQVVRLQIQDVVDTRRGTVSNVFSIYGQPSTVALSFQLDLVPLSIAHVHTAHSDQSFAAAQIEFVLHHAVNDLQNVVVHLAGRVHEVAGRLHRPDSQGQAETILDRLPYQRLVDLVARITLAAERYRVSRNVTRLVMAFGNIYITGLTGISLGALARVSLNGRIWHADFKQRTGIPGALIDHHFAVIAGISVLAITFDLVFVSRRHEAHHVSGHWGDLRRIESDLTLTVTIETVTFIALEPDNLFDNQFCRLLQLLHMLVQCLAYALRCVEAR